MSSELDYVLDHIPLPMEQPAPATVPAIGRIVHYVLYDGPSYGKHRPAIIVHLWTTADGQPDPDAHCNLQVFTDGVRDRLNNVENLRMIPHSEAHEPGTWHWPERA